MEKQVEKALLFIGIKNAFKEFDKALADNKTDEETAALNKIMRLGQKYKKLVADTRQEPI